MANWTEQEEVEMKVGDKVTWGVYGEETTVIEMEDCVVTKVKIEYSDKSTAVLTLVPQPSSVVDMNDLIVIERAPTSPTPPELILEPGKEYLAFPNWRMRCISDLRMEEEGEYPVVMEWYSKDKGWKGPFYYKKDGTHKYEEHNIIGPWNPKPVVDWSLYSKWTKAVAMDKNGIWHWFDTRPVLARADTWNAFKGYLSGIIPPEYAPKNADGSKWEGDWEDSLVVREEE